MFEFNNIFDTAYGTCAVNKAYGIFNSSNDSSTRTPVRDQTVAAIQELFTDDNDIVSLQLSAKDAGTAVSTIQIFSDAIETITEKLAKILELAIKALESYQLQGQVEQQQFRNLAKEINQIADNTKYKFNRPLSGSGKTLSIPAGDGSKIDIIAKDFRFNVQGLNIATAPQNALSRINTAIKDISEYKTDLDKKAAHLVDIMKVIESDIQSALDINMQNFQPELAAPMANYTGSMISQNEKKSLDTKASLSADKILKLLKTS